MKSLNKSGPLALAPACAAVLTLITTTPAFATFIVNGDFEAGNTGFSHDPAYTYVTPGASHLAPEGTYTVDTNPHNSHNDFNSMGDHTTGSGNMLIVNSAVTTGLTIWQGTVSGPLVIGQTYDFSAWVASVFSYSLAELKFSIVVGGLSLGTISPESDGTWKHLVTTFTAAETNPSFKLVNANGEATGNDFAIDDIDLFLAGTTRNPPGAVPDSGPGALGGLTLLALVGLKALPGLRLKLAC